MLKPLLAWFFFLAAWLFSFAILPEIYKDWRQEPWTEARTYEMCLCEFGSFDNLPDTQTTIYRNITITWTPKYACLRARDWAVEHGYEKIEVRYGSHYYADKKRVHDERLARGEFTETYDIKTNSGLKK